MDRTIPMIISESHQSRLSIRGGKYAQSSAVKFKDVKGLQTRDVKYKVHIQVMKGVGNKACVDSRDIPKKIIIMDTLSLSINIKKKN
jgi:hypothetical protein